MTTIARHLRLVPPAVGTAGRSRLAFPDLGLTLFILLVAAAPLVSTIAGVGEWDQTSVGLGTVGVVLASRELATPVLARLRGAP